MILNVSHDFHEFSDFSNFFQAVECYLSNVIPPSDCSEWPLESLHCFVELVSDQVSLKNYFAYIIVT